MLLELAVNGGNPLRASLNRKGLLSAHLNVPIAPDKTDAATIFLNAIDDTDEPNTVCSTWEAGTLRAGDKVEISLKQDGDADPPTEIRRSAGSSKNLFSSTEQARLCLDAISTIDAEVRGIVERARTAEPKEEFEGIARAFVSIIHEIDRSLLTPTLRRHPELLDEAKLKGLIK